MNSLLKPILVGCVVFLLWPIWGHAQSLNLTMPNGGEVWLGGTTHTISWTYTNVDNIKIEYSLNNGLNWTLIIASYPTSALSYTWTVPCIGSNQVKVRITNTLQFTQDESNGVFTIPEPTVDITYPAGGEEFQTGTGQYITWQTTGVVTLALQYSSNDGSSWTSIGNVPATNGYANWIAPNSATSNLRVRAYNIESFTNRDSTLAPLAIVTSPTINNAKYFGGLFDGYDMSSSLPDSIRVVAPNGGEVYNPTSTTQIQWNFCDVNRVKIEYSIDNGAAWILIGTDVPADQLNYTWTIPNSPSNQCLVKVTGIDRNVFDVSDAVFTISNAFVQLVYPNGGESFGNSTGQYIEWDYNSVSTVKLEYSTDNGSSWTLIGTAPAANKYANWIAPASASSQCLIRISDNTVPALSDQSESSFAIVQLPVLNNAKYFGGPYDGYSMNSSVTDSIKVTSPNGGEIWTSASTRTITWTYKDVDNVIIEYSLDDGQSWIQLAQNIPASQLSYNWTIPTTPSYTCRVRVRDMIRDISDMSDQVFIIPNAYVEITYPNGGENYNTGSGQYIEWNYADLATIKLEYSTDNGNTWLVIGTAPAANKYANWVAPSSASTQMLIRATDNSNPIYSDVSNAVFTTNTTPTLNNAKYFGGQFDGYSMYAFKDVYVKVIKPNGGEIWGNGTTQQIRWATLNTNENLKVEYSIDNEQNWTTLLNDVPNSPVTYDWEIASPPSTICKVRATTMSGEVVDKSDDFFTIANPSGILTNPISGNQFCSGESTVVTYSSGLTFNPGNRFIVQLSDSVGTFSGSLINIGEVTSTIPVPITVTFPVRYYTSSLYRLRVIATNTPTLGTNNGTNFTINPLPLVNLGPDRSICAGTSTVLNAMNSNSTYVWSTGATSSSISASTAGTYSVQVTNACGTSRDTIQIGVINTPTVYLGPDTLICQNSVLQLRADSADVSYLWSTGSTSQSINIVVPGTYSVTVSNTCGSAADLITIGNLAPIQVNLGPDRGICTGESVTLNAGTSNASYSWSTGANTPSITVSNPGTYSVNVNNGCGIVSDQITLFNGAFQVNAGIDRTICNGESAQLSATGANAYSWNTGQTTSAITVSPTATTTYTVSATNIYNCTSTDAVVVNVNALPVATSALSGPSTYCSNQPSVLQANTGTGLSYQWQLNGANVSGATAAAYSPTATGNYAVRVTNAQNCSATSAPQTINVLTVPSASITPSGNVNVCSGNSVTLQANSGDGLSYAWNLDGSSLSGAAASSLLATQGGSYTVQVTAANSCFATSAATQITVNETPTISISADGPVSFCEGGIVQLTATATSGTTLQWEKDGVALSGATGATFTATIAGIYSARATSPSNCSSTSGAIVVTVSAIESVSQNESSCGSYTWAVNGTTYNSSGQYTAAVGCTNYTLNLTISGGTNCDDNDPCTINDIILADCSCAGTFADADSDGTCDANDLCAGPEAGAACDDNNPCTVGDVILADCSCAGTFADADNDGTCDANDNCLGQEAGTACDDNNPCTVNDIILADCSCAGTFADADNDGTCDATDNCAGPEAGAACDDNDPCTVNDIILADCSCAGTFADADNDGTCDANDLCAGAEPGTACDDNDPCTTGDIILADCTCAGTFADADNDGTCDANDNCAGPEAGTACNDNDPCTLNDIILADCSCAGTFADADNDGTCDAYDLCEGSEPGALCDDGNELTLNDTRQGDCSCIGSLSHLFSVNANSEKICDGSDGEFTIYGVAHALVYYSLNSNQDTLRLSELGIGRVTVNNNAESFNVSNEEYILSLQQYSINNESPQELNDTADTIIYFHYQRPEISVTATNFNECAELPYIIYEIKAPPLARVHYGYNWPITLNTVSEYINSSSTFSVDYDFTIGEIDSIPYSNYYWPFGTNVFLNQDDGRAYSSYVNHDSTIFIGLDSYLLADLAPENFNLQLSIDSISFEGCVAQFNDIRASVTTPSVVLANYDHFTNCSNGLYESIPEFIPVCVNSSNYEYQYDLLYVSTSELYLQTGINTVPSLEFEYLINNDTIQFSVSQNQTSDTITVDNLNLVFSLQSAGIDLDGTLSYLPNSSYFPMNDTLQIQFLAHTGLDGCRRSASSAFFFQQDTTTYSFILHPTIELNPTTIGLDCETGEALLAVDSLSNVYHDGCVIGYGYGGPIWFTEENHPLNSMYSFDTIVPVQMPGTYYAIQTDPSSCQSYISTINVVEYVPVSCDDNNPCTVGDVITSDCSCAGTFADADNDGTCDANDLCVGPEPGTRCDDNDACTIEDVILEDCTCAGTFTDSDSDGICDASDVCYGPEPGMTCDDGNPCTINDAINGECACVGTLSLPAVGEVSAFTCGSYAWNGNVYTTSGDYEYYTPAASGCDSLTILHLTVGTPTFSSQSVTNCGSYSWNGTTYSQSGTYTFVTTNSTGCPNTATLNLTVNNPSIAASAVIASTNNVSSGTSVTLTVQGGSLGTGASWKWYRSACGGTLIGTGTSITITANTTDTYYVRAEGTCNNTSCATITVNVLSAQCGPEVVSASSTRICSGSSTTLSVLGTLYPGAIWRWRRNSCSGTIVGTGASLSVAPTATTTYYVRAEGGTCGITLCMEITIIVDKMPSTPSVISGPTSGLCNAQNVTYSVTPVSTVQQYNWTVPPGITIVSGQGTASVTVNVSNFINTNPTNGNPAICVTAQNSCGISPIRCLSLTTYPATPASISGTATPCINTVNTYSCPAVLGASSYTWQVPTGWVIQSGQGTASITVLCNGTSGNVRVRTNNSCGNSTFRSLACAPRACSTTAMPMTLELWPNPTSERVFFAHGDATPDQLQIYDMLGRDIYSGNWLSEFDVSGLASGIYFVRATSGGESVVKRMEVVR